MEYFTNGKELVCYHCGKKETANISCPEGHYVCDDCHGKDLFEIVQSSLLNTESQNPYTIAETLMENSSVPMLGCENAWIAAGAFMAALKNLGYMTVTDDQIVEVLNRTKKQAIGGYCGLTGICGIAPAIGSCFSVLLGAACPKDQETAQTMKVVGKVVNAIANQTGPCCCKNFVWTALDVAIESAKELFDMSLPAPVEEIVCTHSARHPHGCRKEKCVYFKSADVTQKSTEKLKAQTLAPNELLINNAIELGVEAVKVIDCTTIAVSDWVQWKCQYGCPFYAQDSLHPPQAPGPEETRKVLREYTKALLLKGAHGPQLSQQAIELEHTAYAMGFYKAFALLALPFGDGPS